MTAGREPQQSTLAGRQRRGAAYLARRARLAALVEDTLLGMRAVLAHVEVGQSAVDGAAFKSPLELRELKPRGARRALLVDADADADADAAAMACSAPNRFAERHPDHYGGLELPPLVARRSLTSGARCAWP